MPESTQLGGKQRFQVCLWVALYSSIIYLPFLGSQRTLTAHEVMAVHPAQRLLEDAQWIVPHYAGGYWLDKPPLINWLVAGCFKLFGGFSEFAARLPSALSAIATCILMTYLAVCFYPRRVALLTGLVQATAAYMFMIGRLAELEMLFTLCLAAAHGILFLKWGAKPADEQQSTYRLPLTAGALFYFFAALATLTKGMVAVALIAFTVLAFSILRRSWRPIAAVALHPGLIVFLLIAGGWHYAAYRTVGDVALEQWSFNGIQRFLGKLEMIPSEPWYSYFVNTPWLMLPWSIVLLIGGAIWLDHWRKKRRDPQATQFAHPAGNRAAVQFLWAWFLGGFAFLMLSQFKHKHYMVPMLPPLSIFTAILIDRQIARGPVASGSDSSKPTGPLLRGFAALERAVPPDPFYIGLFTLAPLLFAAIGAYFMPRQDYRKPTAEFTRNATSAVPAGEPLLVVGLFQSQVYSYIQHAPLVYSDDPNVHGNLAAFFTGEQIPESTMNTIRRTLRDHAGPVWTISVARYLPRVDDFGFVFEERATEPPHKGLTPDKALVVGLLSFAPTSAPASTPSVPP